MALYKGGPGGGVPVPEPEDPPELWPELPVVASAIIRFKDHPFIEDQVLEAAGYEDRWVGDIINVQGIYYELAGVFHPPGKVLSWFLVPAFVEGPEDAGMLVPEGEDFVMELTLDEDAA